MKQRTLEFPPFLLAATFWGGGTSLCRLLLRLRSIKHKVRCTSEPLTQICISRRAPPSVCATPKPAAERNSPNMALVIRTESLLASASFLRRKPRTGARIRMRSSPLLMRRPGFGTIRLTIRLANRLGFRATQCVEQRRGRDQGRIVVDD